MVPLCNTVLMRNKDFEHYLLSNANLNRRQIALKSGINPSTLTRQLNGDISSSFDTVLAIHRGVGLPIIPLLMHSGLITEDEAKKAGGGLTAASDVELAREILRRAEQGRKAMSEPLDNVTQGPWESEVPQGAAARRNRKAKKQIEGDK